MKFSAGLLALSGAIDVDTKKVPPRHPLQRLQRLTQFSAEILDQWFDFLPSKEIWIRKFERNAERMRVNFERGQQKCGFYDPSLPHGGPYDPDERFLDAEYDDYEDFEFDERYDREDPCKGSRQITTGYRKWAQRYLSQCSGQARYRFQIKRMHKWRNILHEHLNRHIGSMCPSRQSDMEILFSPLK
ncbi:unnamed protein product [Oikopleura dioica]|uniref:Uncharacterized protein n=1 Tax=Oikopleura dioica TaxID=34765 RepID=E4XFT0_OIKDI|nr:unnamed protein product [Oikopleura dioica]